MFAFKCKAKRQKKENVAERLHVFKARSMSRLDQAMLLIVYYLHLTSTCKTVYSTHVFVSWRRLRHSLVFRCFVHTPKQDLSTSM